MYTSEWYQTTYNQFFSGDDGRTLFYVAASCAGCLIFLILCMFCCCIRNCIRSGKKSNTNDGKVLAEEVEFDSDPNNFGGGRHHRMANDDVEMRMESISDNSVRNGRNSANFGVDRTVDNEDTMDVMRVGSSSAKHPIDYNKRNQKMNIEEDDWD